MSETDLDPRAYLDRIMAEIDAEVERKRASGEIPLKLERELDELFLAHSPVAGRGGGLGEAIRLMDAAAFIDPVVPVGSNRSGGAVVKKSIRKMSLWYMGFITHQVSKFASATSRALHLVEGRLDEMAAKLDAVAVPEIHATPVPDASGSGAWWAEPTVTTMKAVAGRVLHVGAGDGWLVRELVSSGVDAYGVEPRERLIDAAELEGLDLREESVEAHLAAVSEGVLGGIILTGITDGMGSVDRRRFLADVVRRLGPGGVIVVHTWSPSGWDAPDAPAVLDLSPGRPWRMGAWAEVFEPMDLDVTLDSSPDGRDILVRGVRRGASVGR